MIPSLFICHGSPLLALENSPYTHFLAETGKRFQPKAIVMFSAHWEQQVTTISFVEGTLQTIYDFGGFPDELYQLNYPAQGSPELAERLEERFRLNGIATRRDYERGLDQWLVGLLKAYVSGGKYSDCKYIRQSISNYEGTA